MSSFNARLFTQRQMRVVPHTSVSGENWQLVKTGTATGNGAANGTTVVDTNSDSGGANTYNGAYWIRLLSQGGNATKAGDWKRIVDDDGSGTYTMEGSGFTRQVVTGDEFEIWKSPEPVAIVTTRNSSTSTDFGNRTEAADFWIGYSLIPINGACRGEVVAITDSTGGGGFTHGALTGTIAAGDVCLLGKFIEIAEPSRGITENYVKRPQSRVNFSVGDGTVAERGGTFQFRTPAAASGSLQSTASEYANTPAVSALMEASGLEPTIGKTCDITTGSSTTAIKITSGQRENLEIGQAVVYNGELRWITALADGGAGADTVTVSPALSIIPTTGGKLYATSTYKKSTDGDMYGCTIELEMDGIRETMTGCKGNVTIVDGAVIELDFNLNVGHWVREIEAAPYFAGPRYSTASYIKNSDRYFDIAGTRHDVGSFTASPNTVVKPRMIQGASGVNGFSGFQVTEYNCTASWRELLNSATDELTREDQYYKRTTMLTTIIYGSHGNAMSVRIPVGKIIGNPIPANAEGMLDVPVVVEAQDAGTALNDTTVTKVPDFALAFS